MKSAELYFLRVALLVAFLCVLASFSNAAGQPAIIDSSSSVTDEDENWNSHIDNQAYLREYEQRRRQSQQQSPPVIIINREISRPYGWRGWRNCDSETISIQSGNSTFVYSDGYRVNCYPHHVIVPVPRSVRPAPTIHKQNGKRVWTTGQ